jgi:hypothetical protein
MTALRHFPLLLLVPALTACQGIFLPAGIATLPSVGSPSEAPTLIWTGSPSQEPSIIAPTETKDPSPALTLVPSITLTPTVTPLPVSLGLDPADWQNWPVLPIVSEHAREIYLLGQTLGNDPHAFSVFGDCQSEPEVFMGVYDTDPALLASLTPDLQQTVTWFAGSFKRKSPTVRGGTTTGALLWPEWTQGDYGCTPSETPVQCELRIHKPSFVIIQVGTHYEARNEEYMRTILDQLLAAGVVPILATKADDRELDQHVNAGYAQLAVEYNIPFWNFWASVRDFPNGGLYTRSDSPYQGDLYLTEDAKVVHRLTALESLDVVWQAVTGFR